MHTLCNGEYILQGVLTDADIQKQNFGNINQSGPPTELLASRFQKQVGVVDFSEYQWVTFHFFSTQKIRNGGSTALYTAYTVDTVDTIYIVQTIQTAYTASTEACMTIDYTYC